MSQKIKIAYLGSGPISNFHVPALRMAGFEINHIFSRENSQRLKSFAAKHNIKKVSKNLKEFIYESKDVDAFVIAIKTEATYPLLKILSNKKKPILVEKPGSLQAKDLKKIKFKDKIFFAYNRRFYDSVYWFKKFLKKKNSSFVSVTIPDTIKTYHQFIINGCHVIDLLSYIFGKLKLLSINKTKNKNENGILIIMKSFKGDLINIILNWGAPDNFSINAFNNNERFELRPLEIGRLYKTLEVIEPTKKNPIRLYQPKVEKTYFTSRKFRNFKPGFVEQYLSFKNIILKNKKDKKLCSFDEAIENLQIINKIILKSKK